MWRNSCSLSRLQGIRGDPHTLHCMASLQEEGFDVNIRSQTRYFSRLAALSQCTEFPSPSPIRGTPCRPRDCDQYIARDPGVIGMELLAKGDVDSGRSSMCRTRTFMFTLKAGDRTHFLSVSYRSNRMDFSYPRGSSNSRCKVCISGRLTAVEHCSDPLGSSWVERELPPGARPMCWSCPRKSAYHACPGSSHRIGPRP